VRVRKEGVEKRKKLSKRELRPKRADLGDMTGGSDGFAMTLKEIAQEMGITKERVRQLIYSALGKIAREHPELKEWVE